MKKRLSLVLCLVMVLSMFSAVPFTVSAAVTNDIAVTGDVDPAYPDFTYKLLGDGTAEITKYNGSGADVTIPSKLSGYKVTSIGNYAFNFHTSLKRVTIPDSVTSIGDSAFNYCTNLTGVTIPDSVTSIGSQAFYTCKNLTSVTIGNSVTSIGTQAFGYCDNLTSVTIGNSVTSIGNYAFGGCKSLKSVTIPDSVTSLGHSAFLGCESLTSVKIGNSVTSIEGSVFENCTSLKSVTIPDSVTSIGGSAFKNCASLTSVTIPDSVTGIASEAFYDCENLTSVTIGSAVTSIGSQAFCNCSLKSVMIPESVTTIGSYYPFGYYYDDNWKTQKIEGFTIYGFPDTEAERYANKNGFTFIALEHKPQTVSGTITSFLSETDPITVQLLQSGNVKHTATVKGKTVSYSIPNVEIGAYTMRVSKNNHVTRDYAITVYGNTTQDVKICLKGDADGDGVVSATDAMMAYRAARGKATSLDDYGLKCADVDGEDGISAADAMLIYRKARGKNVSF